MKELVLFGSAFGVVFALGFQSLSVNAGYYRIAFCNSLLIGTFNLFLYKLVPDIASPLEIGCYLIGGPIGMVCAMKAHGRLKAWLVRRQSQTGVQPETAMPARHYDELPGGMSEKPLGRYDGGRYGS